MEATFLFWFKNDSIAYLFSQRYPMNSGTTTFEPLVEKSIPDGIVEGSDSFEFGNHISNDPK